MSCVSRDNFVESVVSGGDYIWHKLHSLRAQIVESINQYNNFPLFLPFCLLLYSFFQHYLQIPFIFCVEIFYFQIYKAKPIDLIFKLKSFC